jgi:ATP-binding cassette, subfamily B, bacterial
LHESAFGEAAEGGDPFEPRGIECRYPPPRARIDADRDKGWFARLWPILWGHAGLVAISLSLLVLLAVIEVTLIWVVGQTLDVVVLGSPAHGATSRALSFLGITLHTGAAPPVQPFVLTLGVLSALQLGVGYLAGTRTALANQSIEYCLRTLVYEQLTRLSFSFYDRSQTGQLISRANADIRAVQMYLAFAPRLISAGLSFALALGLMLSESVLLAAVTVATLPGVYLVGLAMRSRLFPISWVIQARQADIATIVEENVTGVRIVKSFNAERGQIAQLARASERLRWAGVKQVDIRARYAPLLAAIPRLSRAVLLGVGGWLVLEGQTTIGALLAFNFYVMRLQAPFRLIGFLMIMAQRAAASALRIFEILDEAPEIADAPHAVPLRAPSGELVFDKVSFGYAGHPPLLRELSLRIAPGETVALVGRTGCGKSTLARLVPRFYDVREGAVRIDGRDVREYTVKSLRSWIGIVPDEPFLFSESLRANIAYGRPDAPLAEIIEAARAAGADEFITRLEKGYDTVVGERGYTLSGGQRQRVAIARTLLANPRFLILDDATSSIDVQLEHQIHAALRELMRGRTTLVIAHRVSTIRLADRVVLLDGGRIAAQGTHEALLRTVPAYREILEHGGERERPLRPVRDESPPRRRRGGGEGAGLAEPLVPSLFLGREGD